MWDFISQCEKSHSVRYGMYVSRILDFLAVLFTFLWELKQNSIKLFKLVQELWSFFANCPGTKIFANCLGMDTQNLELGTASTNNKWHLTIPWARSCQYQCVSKSSSQYSTFAFFAKDLGTKSLPTVRWRILRLGPIGHTRKSTFSVSPKVNLQLLFESCNIPLRSRDYEGCFGIFTFHFLYLKCDIPVLNADLYHILYWKIKRVIFV